ncbi:MAG: LysM peptidoglycan-binding domain-containing protein [Candidatus Promineifilaceae bacterium]|nr:LysM peptidoglycan-binding domain-containing protein [Anaerolineaceae bacterium]
MSKKIIIGILFCLFLLVGEATAVQAQSASAIFQEVNQFRSNNGLAPFQYSNALATAAQNQANFMAANTIFSSHVGAGGSTPQSRANAAGYVGSVSENIVGGSGMTAARGLSWWVASPVHYNTLVTSRYQEAGTGFASNGSENFYVLVVGQPSDAPPPPANDTSPAPLFITPITLAQPGEDGSIVHLVQEGQALWSLAAHYEVSLSDLLLFNSLPANAIVQPGDRITIRLAEGQAPPPTPTPSTMHTVLEGQSLWAIAVQYNVKLGDILWLNGLPEDAILQPGEQIRVRLAADEAPPPTPTPILYHTVRSEQTLWEIALTYNLSLDALLALNNMDAGAILQPGDLLLVRQMPPTPEPTAAPTATPQPTAVPTQTATQVTTAVSAQISQPPATPIKLQSAGETAVAPEVEEGGGIGRIVTGLAIGLLAVGILAVVVLRSELFS